MKVVNKAFYSLFAKLFILYIQSFSFILYKALIHSLQISSFIFISFQEPRDLEERIQLIIKGVEEENKKYSNAPKQPSPRKRHRHSLKTRPYSDGNEESVMDDEELHSLLGV